MFDIQSVPDWPSLREADTARGTTLGHGADVQTAAQSFSEVVGVPRPTLVMTGWCEGTVDWEVGLLAECTATGWLQSADCWQTLTCCCGGDRISVLTLQAWRSIHWIRNIHKFQCFIWFKYQQESRAAARKPRDAASVLFRWSSPTTFTTSIRTRFYSSNLQVQDYPQRILQ